MRTQRAFRPAAFDHQLETREVLDAAGLSLAQQMIAQRAAIAANLNAGRLRLNTPFLNGNGVATRTLANPGAVLNFTRTVTLPTGGFNSNLGFSRIGFNSGLNTANTGLNTASGINNGFFTTFNNPNFGLFGTGVSNGLAFNNGLGIPGASSLFNNGASTGLAFNNGLGVPGNTLGFASGLNAATPFITGGTTGLAFNNGLGVPGTTAVNGALTGLAFNNGLGPTGNLFTNTPGTGLTATNGLTTGGSTLGLSVNPFTSTFGFTPAVTGTPVVFNSGLGGFGLTGMNTATNGVTMLL